MFGNKGTPPLALGTYSEICFHMACGTRSRDHFVFVNNKLLSVKRSLDNNGKTLNR